MTDVELRLTADTDGATAGVRGFRKEYADLVKTIERPIRQIDALQRTQESAKSASAEFFAAKRRVDELKKAISTAGQPVAALDRELAKAERTLTKATQAFERQKQQVKEQRAELKAAGVDTRNLAAEQQRLQAALGATVAKGKADAAVTSALDGFGVTRLRELRAQLVSLNADYKRLTQAGVLSASERTSAEIQYQARLAETKRAISEITGESASGAAGLAAIGAKLAGIVAAAYAVQRTAGAYFGITAAVGELEDRMRNALPVHEQYERAQARLEDISKRVRIPLAQTSELFLGAVGPLREMGFSASATADMVGALSAGLVANSVKGQQAEAVINQFTKGLQTGVIRGDAFNAILQNSPALTDALTKGLGTTRAELIRMANAGELTTEKVVTAFASQSDALLKLADAMRTSVPDAQGTFSDSVDRVVASIDKLLGLSEHAVKELDGLTNALDAIADGGKDVAPILDAYAETVLKRLGLSGIALEKLYSQYRKWEAGAKESVESVIDAEQRAAAEREALQEQILAEQRAYANEFNSITQDLAVKFKSALDQQVAAQRKAASALSKARNEQLETEKRYRDALDRLNAGVKGPASYANAQSLQYAARQALASGDVERAKKNAQAALDMLLDLAEAGENTYGFAGFIQGLQSIEQEADRISVEKAERSLEEATKKTREWKAEFETLKNFKITPSIDDEALARETEKLKQWAAMIGASVTIEPRSLTQDPLRVPGSKDADGYVLLNETPQLPAEFVLKDVVFPDGEKPVIDAVVHPVVVEVDSAPVEVSAAVDDLSIAGVTQQIKDFVAGWAKLTVLPVRLAMDAVAPSGASVDGFSGGGWTGPGGKYQPAGIVHAGEHVQPQEVVREPGALAFLERIRRNGFRATLDQLRLRGYANGGPVVPVPRFVPNVPAPSPALLEAAAGPQFPHLGQVDLSLAGASYTMYVEREVASELRLAARQFGRTHR
ncbi:tape measure protein [Stutzerimonas stutzeri]|uniref:tape measure protein n=1 Tax=Stutzerimonas stutzeri TaxID=316 RepID=UPI002449F1C0|nr:tape measure protein [Stutzerimonas stutzeri]MDH0120843.1 tape measure protein [Stutzerimonas stutzeri]